MRSIGVIFANGGGLRAAWHWQDRTRGCPFHLPIQHGDEVVLLDPEHPDCPDEIDPRKMQDRQELRNLTPDEARTEIKVSLPSDPDHEHFIMAGLMVVKEPKGQPDAEAIHVPEAVIERIAPQGKSGG